MRQSVNVAAAAPSFSQMPMMSPHDIDAQYRSLRAPLERMQDIQASGCSENQRRARNQGRPQSLEPTTPPEQVKIFNSLLRAGPEPRSVLLKWVGEALSMNSAAGGFQPDRSKVETCPVTSPSRVNLHATSSLNCLSSIEARQPARHLVTELPLLYPRLDTAGVVRRILAEPWCSLARALETLPQ